MNSLNSQLSGFAALFIDFENIFYFLKNKYYDPPELDDYAFEMLRNLNALLENKYGLQTIIMKAYADFERLGTPAQGSLYLMGIDTHNVLGTEHKNAADMRLCIDALEVLYTRPEIQSFIFVAGDRDYIPVIQHLKKQARAVFASAFRENVSGDLLQNVGKAKFIDALDLLSAETIAKLEHRKRYQEIQKPNSELLREKGLPAFNRLLNTSNTQEKISNTAEKIKENLGSNNRSVTKSAPKPLPKPTTSDESPPLGEFFEKVHLLEEENEVKCLEFILENIGHRHELWLGPFLRRINEKFPLLADFERKMLLERLVRAGAVRIEKRQGDPYDFTVLLVNYNHPDVRVSTP